MNNEKFTMLRKTATISEIMIGTMENGVSINRRTSTDISINTESTVILVEFKNTNLLLFFLSSKKINVI